MRFPLADPMGDGALRIAQELAGFHGAQSEEHQEHAVQTVNVARFLRAAKFLANDFNVSLHVKCE